jgi:hypothetical protein
VGSLVSGSNETATIAAWSGEREVPSAAFFPVTTFVIVGCPYPDREPSPYSLRFSHVSRTSSNIPDVVTARSTRSSSAFKASR